MAIRQNQFAGIVAQYQRLVVTVCFSFTKNYFDAEDLAQETFLSAYENIGRFDGKNLKAWLCAIAANKCRDYLKRPVCGTAYLTEEDYACLEDGGPPPGEQVESRVMEENVQELCMRLKEPYKSVAIGYFCRGLSLSEIARASGQNLKTLQTRLYRSKKLLKALWEEEHI